MLFRLVTLAEARDQLSILDSAEDARLDRLVLDASQIVMDYLRGSKALAGWTDTDGIPLVDDSGNPKQIGGVYEVDDEGNPVLDDEGNPVPVVGPSGEALNPGNLSVVPGPVRAATLLIIAALDDDREGKGDPISLAVASLLMRFRDPVFA